MSCEFHSHFKSNKGTHRGSVFNLLLFPGEFVPYITHSSSQLVKKKRISCIPNTGILHFNIYEDWGSSHLKGQTVCFTVCGTYYVNIENNCFQELIWWWCWKALHTTEIWCASKNSSYSCLTKPFACKLNTTGIPALPPIRTMGYLQLKWHLNV